MTTSFWNHLYANQFGHGWEDMLASTDGDNGEAPRLLPESPRERDIRDHDEGFGCASGVEHVDGSPWLVCYVHDTAVEIAEP